MDINCKKLKKNAFRVSKVRGEIASRREYTSRLLDTGVDCLSVAPAEILIMRDHIINNCR